MLRLMSFTEFKNALSFDPNVGLCCNMDNVYSHNLNMESIFREYLIQRGLSPDFPIGAGGYGRKGNGDCLSVDKFQRNRLLYVESNLYSGMQEALRHNLYEAFCDHLVSTNPNDYCR